MEHEECFASTQFPRTSQEAGIPYPFSNLPLADEPFTDVRLMDTLMPLLEGLAGLTSAQLAQTVQEVEACGAETCLITTDVTEAAQVAQMVRLTLERFATMEDTLSLAHAVREACLTAAVRAYEDAGLGGLCHEGRWG